MQTILPRTSQLQVGEAIRIATRFLSQHDLVFGHGTGAAEDDAAWLVLECAGLSPIEQPDYNLVLSHSAVERCDRLLHQRVNDRIPVAYLVGRTWFAGLEFKADSRALVPRSPISELIPAGFCGLVDVERPFSVLDLCTGGGCIAIATAFHLPQASVVATDLSIAALELAAENVALHELQDRVSLQQGDLFAPVTGQFDLIVSNPPYVDQTDVKTMGAEYHCEPPMGLASGTDGLDITRKILAQAADYLNPGGVLIVEVGNSAEALDLAFPQLPFEWFEFSYGGDGVFALHREDLTAI